MECILNKQRAAVYVKRQKLLGDKAIYQILSVLDLFWMNHLEAMEALRESVRIRAYGQHDPIVEYRRESHILYKQMINDFEKWVEDNQDKLEELKTQQPTTQFKTNENANKQSSITSHTKKVGRNEPCPCGSGKKYKKCCGA